MKKHWWKRKEDEPKKIQPDELLFMEGYPSMKYLEIIKKTKQPFRADMICPICQFEKREFRMKYDNIAESFGESFIEGGLVYLYVICARCGWSDYFLIADVRKEP